MRKRGGKIVADTEIRRGIFEKVEKRREERRIEENREIEDG